MKDLRDKVAVITGAASGIGLGIARMFGREGMRIVAADIDGDRLAAEVRGLAHDGVDIVGVPTDVGDRAAVEALADAAYARHGAVHVVVNNAGIIASGRSWELPLADWERVLRVNLWGVLHGIQVFVPRMLAQDGEGHVVNIGSMASVVPVPMIGPYNVAKHGVLALSEGLAAELAATGVGRIGVTLVMPGRVSSRLGGGQPDPSAMDPDDVGFAVVEAIQERRLFCFTHPERVVDAERRFDRILGRDR